MMKPILLNLRYYWMYLEQCRYYWDCTQGDFGLTKSSFWFWDGEKTERVDVWIERGPRLICNIEIVSGCRDTTRQFQFP